jgi:hypothetical protein
MRCGRCMKNQISVTDTSAWKSRPILPAKRRRRSTRHGALWKAVQRENVMIKVPGTAEGLPAIRQLIGEGININVTLLFAQDVYEKGC